MKAQQKELVRRTPRRKVRPMETQCRVCGKKLDGREFHSHTHVMINKSELAALKAVADAAEEYTKVHGHNFGSGCACLLCEVEMALDALKGAE